VWRSFGRKTTEWRKRSKTRKQRGSVIFLDFSLLPRSFRTSDVHSTLRIKCLAQDFNCCFKHGWGCIVENRTHVDVTTVNAPPPKNHYYHEAHATSL
jgi:hypothetical protein